MDSVTLTIGDLKSGDNKTWNYPRFQLNLTNEDAETLSQPLHENFRIHLKFPHGKITDEKGNEYEDGFFTTRLVKDHPGRFGRNIVYAICAVWESRKSRDGLLTGWLKSHKLKAGDKVKISLEGNNYYLEPSSICNY
ncbi:MAG: hypothetical protein JW716_03825 [Candidatus Aenigmarchaeota archaeon]|nr:hypothetical protein [Candidatus Aenigmarchaeota archaeon]